MAVQVTQTINDALIELGVIDTTEEPTPEDSAFGLRTLNRVCDYYNTQNLFSPNADIIYETIPGGWTSTRCTISRGVISTNHPQNTNDEHETTRGDTIDGEPLLNISRGYFRYGDADFPLAIMTQTEYSRVKKLVVNIPTKMYIVYSKGKTIIHFDCIPQGDMQLRLIGKYPFYTDLTFNDVVDWETGVERMLYLRLAVELAASYHIDPSQITVQKLLDAENTVKAHNYQPLTLRASQSLLIQRRSRWHSTNLAL